MRRSVLALLLAGLTMQCAPALAASVRISDRTGWLEYRAAPGEQNHVRISAHYSVEDSVPIEAGRNCRRAHPGRRNLVECDVDTFGAKRAVVRLGDRSDRARIMGDFESARVEAGRGDDIVRGGAEPDVLLGGPGTDALYGGAGVDRLFAGGLGMTDAVTADRLVGGAESDFLAGSAGANSIDGGPGVDKVAAGRGRDIVQARDDAIEQLHCGAGEDSAITDGVDFPLACEHHEPYSRSSPVPVELSSGTGSPRTSVLLGCREGHPAACAGTIQLELDGTALTGEQPFTFANRHRFVILLDHEPMPADWGGLVVRIRAPDAAGAPVDQRYPIALMLVGSPFLGF